MDTAKLTIGDYQLLIETRAGVSIAMQRQEDDDGYPVGGFYAWANRQVDWNRSQTIANAFGGTEFEALSNLAFDLQRNHWMRGLDAALAEVAAPLAKVAA